VPVEVGEAGPNDTSKVQEGFFINLVPGQQFGVVAKIAKEPRKLPKGAIRAVEAPREGKCFMGGWLQDAEAEGQEGLLRMPAIGSALDPNQEESIEVTDQILLAGMETGNVSSHDLASTGWE
jgi:hypothetical protein